MIRTRNHGGQCCGIDHVFNFNKGSEKNDILELTNVLASIDSRRPSQGLLTEVVLTTSQLRDMPELVKYLKETGFVLVTRFKNENSRNICNVFHYTKAGRPLARLPFAWDNLT